jgi:hypothetical protein
MTTAAITNASRGQAMPSRTPQVYNKDQWISSFEDLMVKLRPAHDHAHPDNHRIDGVAAEGNEVN